MYCFVERNFNTCFRYRIFMKHIEIIIIFFIFSIFSKISQFFTTLFFSPDCINIIFIWLNFKMYFILI